MMRREQDRERYRENRERYRENREQENRQDTYELRYQMNSAEDARRASINQQVAKWKADAVMQLQNLIGEVINQANLAFKLFDAESINKVANGVLLHQSALDLKSLNIRQSFLLGRISAINCFQQYERSNADSEDMVRKLAYLVDEASQSGTHDEHFYRARSAMLNLISKLHVE